MQSRLEALQKTHALYRKARELHREQSMGGGLPASPPPTVRAATSTSRFAYSADRPPYANSSTPVMTKYASTPLAGLTPRQQTQSTLAGTLRSLRGQPDEAPQATPGTEPRRATLEGIRSPLEAQLLGLLGAASGLEQERDELLAALRQADTDFQAVTEEASLLRGENEELRQTIKDLEETAEASAGSADGNDEAAAELLYEAQRRVDDLAAQLEDERRDREALEALVEERTAALNHLEEKYHEILHLRGGGGTGDGGVDHDEGVGDDAHEDDETDAAGEEGDEEGVNRQGDEALDNQSSALASLADDALDLGALEIAATNAPATTGASARARAPQTFPDPPGAQPDVTSSAPTSDLAPAPGTPSAPKGQPALGKLQWFGFRLPSTEESAPTSSFRTKFPPMACALGDSGTMVLAGGGGASKTGIPNAIVFCAVPDGSGCVQLAHHGTGLEAVTGVALSAAARVLACVQGDGVEMYELLPISEALPTGAPDVPPPPRLASVQRLNVDPPGASPGIRASTASADLPPELRAYAVCLDPTGMRLAVGMEDGALLIFAKSGSKLGDGALPWALVRRVAAHKKELKSMAFSYDGAILCTCAPDGQALLWDTRAIPGAPEAGATGGVATAPPPGLAAPIALAKPAFRLFNFFGGASSSGRRGKKRDMSPQWRCVAMPSAPPASSRASTPLFAALNHPGGPGWIVRADTGTGQVRAYRRACSSMVPTIAVSEDGKVMVAGNSEGELLVFDGPSLSLLFKAVPHELFITSIMLRAAPAGGIGALTGAMTYTAITCCGDNSVKLTPLPPGALKKRASVAPFVYLALMVALVAYLMQCFPSLLELLLPERVQPFVAMLLGIGTPAAPAQEETDGEQG